MASNGRGARRGFTRLNNIGEICGAMLGFYLLDEGGCRVRIECRTRARTRYLSLLAPGGVADPLLRLPENSPVSLVVHVSTETKNRKGSEKQYVSQRLEVDRVIPIDPIDLTGSACKDRNDLLLRGEVMTVNKMTGSRLKVVLSCEDGPEAPETPEVVLLENPRNITPGVRIEVRAYWEARKVPNSKFTLNTIIGYEAKVLD